MKKMFGKSKRTKEKEKQLASEQHEHDMLYGRRNRIGGDNNSTRSMLSQSTTSGSYDHRGNVNNGDSGQSARNSTGKNSIEEEEYDDGERSSMSTAYYRGETIMAVSSSTKQILASTSESDSIKRSANIQEMRLARGTGGSSISGLSSSPGGGSQNNHDWNDASMAPVARGGGSEPSGLSQSENDRLPKSTLKHEHRSMKHNTVRERGTTRFEDRLTKSAISGSSYLYGDDREDSDDDDLDALYEEDYNPDDHRSKRHDKDDRNRRQHHHHHRKDRKHAQSEVIRPRTHRGSDDDNSEKRGHRSRTSQEEQDRKIKNKIRKERDSNKESHRSGGRKGSDEDVEQSRRRNNRDQEDNDKSVKERLREERLAHERGRGDRDKKAKERLKVERFRLDQGGRDHGDSNGANDEELEEKRRRQRERSEKDKKMKQSIRQQRDAAKEIRAQGDANFHEEDDELEQKRRRQREQSEKDREMKQSIRQQRDAAKVIRAQGDANFRQDEDDELEQKRRRQREQSEKDREMKQSIRQQRDAVKELRQSSAINKYSNNDESYHDDRHGRRQKEWKEEDYRKGSSNSKSTIRKGKQADDMNNKRVYFNNEDSFENALNDSEGLGFNPKSKRNQSQDSQSRFDHEEEEEFNSYLREVDADKDDYSYNEEVEEEHQQNLIDMHIAQFRATAKISTIDDNSDEDYDDCFPDMGPTSALSEFEEGEYRRNAARRMSRRVSTTTMKINAWHQKYTLKKALELAERTPEMEWVTSFYRCDPRWQIMKFFDEVAREGGEAPLDENLAASPLANLFNKANVFTVWRPTSDEAIKNMMLGVATGKGLDIKGKSAKKGNISSYVPFIQIYEDLHKDHVRSLIKDGRIVRVFYQTEEARTEAHEMILDIKDFMLFAAEDAMRVLSDEYADQAEQELAMKHLMYDDTNLAVNFVDTYADGANPVVGLDITERLFWETYVMMQDCSRRRGTEWDIGRGSELTFMDMNFKAIRHDPAPGEPRAVVYQFSKCSPMEPRMLLMAYEEHGVVKPVVSDFDCFLLGSRGVKYKEPIPPEQIELVKWSVKNIREVLDERAASDDTTAGWMETWFKVLKKAALKGYYPKTPKYGNGDPKSYEIIQVAVDRLKTTGCVRHGAECFNWFFPQEIDDKLLVISDTLPGNVKWKRVNVHELQDLLITKIEEGFTFPINPKWVLCDPGWRRVYDKLLASQKPNVQDSINCWLPPDTGLRAEIDAISALHPLGFEATGEKTEGTEVMDLMEDDLERYFKIQRAWRKLRLVLFWIRFVREKRFERQEREAAALASYGHNG